MKAKTALGRFLARNSNSPANRRRRARRLWAEPLEDRCLLTGILSVSPTFAAPGTTDLSVEITLDSDATPPAPPSFVMPQSASIGTIAGMSLGRSDMIVTASFDIPADEPVGSKDVAVTFPTPNGTVTMTLDAGFTVISNGLPIVSVAATDANAAEAGLDPGTFVITRAGDTDGDLTVQWTVGGSATEGDDFTALSRSVVIPDGESTATLTVTPLDDQDAESTETVSLTLTTDESYMIGTPASATVRIADDDGETSGTTYPIVDTGQMTFYDDSVEIAAPDIGAAFYGQDAQYTDNQPHYTLSADGLTVYDEVTDLTWTQSADLNGDGTIDVDDKLMFSDLDAYADSLNAENFGGFDDWRAPTIKELYSLIDFRGIDPSSYTGNDTSGLVPFIDTNYFDFGYGDTSAGERIIDAQFWSSTEYVSTVFNGVPAAFGVNFADGRIKGYPTEMKAEYAYFVRGNVDYGINNFVDNGDGTVTDLATGLMWMQIDSGVGMNWEDALAYAESFEFGGYDDWHLPNVKQLESIVDYSRSPSTTGSAAIDQVFDTSTIVDEEGKTDYPFYWSGTTHANTTNTPGSAGAYVSFGEALGYMNGSWMDVHGAGAQRSDPKDGDPADWPTGHGPQGDAIRIFNYVRLVRNVDETATPVTDVFAWQGGDDVWSAANWHDGDTADQQPATDAEMAVDVAGSVVRVEQDFVAGGTGPADSVTVGKTQTAELQVNATLEVSNDVYIGPSGTLSGSGTVQVGDQVRIEGDLAPGDGIGTLTAEGDVTLDGSTIAIELSGSGALVAGTNNDLLATHDLTLTGSPGLELQWLPGQAGDGLFGGIYTIATYSGSLTGTFAAATLSASFNGADASVYIDTTYGTGGIDYGSGTGDAITVKLKDLLLGDANLDGDVDVWQSDGTGDAQVLSANLGNTTGAVWTDGDFNLDGDVDVWQFDGNGDAQLMTGNLGTNLDIAPKQATIVQQGEVEPLPAAVDWQFELERTQIKAAKRKDVEATVDMLMVTGWE